jgi:hypothetical protein
MQRVVFVEVLDRRGRPKSRSRLASLPISIGRAYTNDVIVDDRYVSPEHLRVTVGEDGRLMAVDLESLNGLFVAGHHERKSSVLIEPGLKLRIGETVLRFIDAEEPVADAKPMARRSKGLLHQLNRKAVALLVIALGILAFVLDAYLEFYQELDWDEFLGPVVGIGVFSLIWAWIWSFSNRLVSHRFDFLRHLAFFCFMMIAMLVIQPVCEYVQFLSPSEIFSFVFATLAYGTWLILLLSGHLAIIGSLGRRRRWAWAFGVVATVVSITVLLQYAYEDDFSRGISISTPIKALGAEWLTTQSMDDFLSESSELKGKVDALAAESE